MFFAPILFALIVAVLLTLVFAFGLSRGASLVSWWAFFMLIFLLAWAAGLWLAPAGPVAWNVAWLPILITGILVALLLAAVAPPRRPRGGASSEPRPPVPPPGGPARDADLNAFFWILVAGFLIVIVLGYTF
jgi:hypothetical protein